MTAEEMFHNYNELRQQRALLDMQIQYYSGVSEADIIESQTFGHPDDNDRVQSSTISDKTASIAMRLRKMIARDNKAYYKFLLDEYRQVDEEICFFEKALETMGHPKADIILEMVRDGSTWDTLAHEYCVSRSTIRNYKNEAVEVLNDAYDKRDAINAKFMLS